MQNLMSRPVAKTLAGAAILAVGNAAQAVTAYDSITAAADWSTVATAIIGVFAAGATVLVAFVGGKFLLRAIRGV